MVIPALFLSKIEGKIFAVLAFIPCMQKTKGAAKANPFSEVSINSLRVMIGQTTSAVEIERLLVEYESLARRQYEVLQRLSYAQLSRRGAAAYDARFLRIQEISKEIIRLRSEGP